MLDYFNAHPVVQWIGTIVIGVIGLLIPFIIYLVSRSRKKLSYELVSATPIIRKEEKGRLQVLFDGQEVENAYSTVMSIVNNGNVPIKSDEFERPISISMGEGKFLSVEIKDTNPKSLHAAISFRSDLSFTIEPLLLNPGDSIQVSMLATTDKLNPPNARIVGINEIGLVSTGRFARPLIAFGMVITIASMVYQLVYHGKGPSNSSSPNWAMNGFLVVGQIFVIAGMLNNRIIRKLIPIISFIH